MRIVYNGIKLSKEAHLKLESLLIAIWKKNPNIRHADFRFDKEMGGICAGTYNRLSMSTSVNVMMADESLHFKAPAEDVKETGSEVGLSKLDQAIADGVVVRKNSHYTFGEVRVQGKAKFVARFPQFAD